MATTTYFLGANTPKGFVSHYDTLFSDPRIRELIILKGGPGCGKSTLMRRVGEAAAQLGCDTEEILCSSDPDSLDGLIVPQAELAIVDGTSPHVVEPPLCGLGARYLDLGRFYDGELLQKSRDALLAAKDRNAACYPLCYAALRCAEAASDGMLEIARAALPAAVLPEALERLAPELPPKPDKAPAHLRRFLRAISPKGLLQFTPVCKQLVILHDSFGLSAPLLAAIRDRAADAGYNTVSCSDPLSPNRLQALFLPELALGFAAFSRLFPQEVQTPPCMDFDALAAACLPVETEQRLRVLESLRERAMQEALVWLSRAKRAHDALEQAYRPAVDFSGVSEAANAVVRALERRLQ